MTINDANSPPRMFAPARVSRMSAIDLIAPVLMIVGGVNWWLVGLFDIDLMVSIFEQMTTSSRVVYAVVGLAALYGIVLAIRHAAPADPGAALKRLTQCVP